MGKRQRILLVGLLAVALGGLAWELLRQREPVYQGKPLSFWLEGYAPEYRDAGPSREKAEEAVRQIGTSAIPTLLRMLRAKDSSLKLRIAGLVRRQRIIRGQFYFGLNRRRQAARAFATLGDSASNAVPSLCEIFDQGDAQSLIAEILGSLGPSAGEAVPSLLRGVTSTNMFVRYNAVSALGQINAEPGLVVPTLVKSMKDPDYNVRDAAAIALGSFGPRAKLAVPALAGLLQGTDDYIKHFATNALLQIDPAAAIKAGVR